MQHCYIAYNVYIFQYMIDIALTTIILLLAYICTYIQ